MGSGRRAEFSSAGLRNTGIPTAVEPQQPDEEIWEVREPRRHFTHSKVMAWVAFDRAVKDAEQYHLEGPLDRWRDTRDAIHAQVCEAGFDTDRNTFVQFHGSTHLDASLLLIPQAGFLPAVSAQRVLGDFPQALTHMALINTARLLSIPLQRAQGASRKGERPAAVSQV